MPTNPVRDVMLLAAAVFIAVGAVRIATPPTPTTTVTGTATIHDGDTLRVRGVSIRLWGIDAEELGEPHGASATEALKAIVGTSVVTCMTSDRSYNRLVARCRTDTVPDLGAEMVRRGEALDCRHYSGGHYRSLEPTGIRTVLTQKPYC